MNFQKWINLYESSVEELYDSTVKAFPKTTKRQHAIDLIDITELNWTPYLGMKTLFVKGVAHSQESNKDYDTVFLIKNVNYNPTNILKNNVVEITSKDGQKIYVEKFDEKNDVLVRCNCQDFLWRWNYTDYKDKSLNGRVRKKYEAIINPGSSNPLEMPGMCKHLIKCYKTILNTVNSL
jgi:hypothetical protein